MLEQVSPRVVANRQQIAAAAHQLFVTRGYTATTIADLAEAAGVAVQTIYNTVGNKAAVLSHVLDTVVAGDQPAGTVVEFMQARVAAAGSVDDVVDVLADWFAEVHPRTADVFAIIHEAAAVDAAIATLRRRRERARLDHYRLAAQAIAARGGLPTGHTLDDLAAAIWSLAHPDTFAFLTKTAGWDLARYRTWIERQLHCLLATPP